MQYLDIEGLSHIIDKFSTQISNKIEFAEEILEKLKTIDGPNSGLDADTLDGKQLTKLDVLDNVNVTHILENDNLNNYITSGVYIIESAIILNTISNIPDDCIRSNARLIVVTNTGTDGTFDTFGYQLFISGNGLFVAVRYKNPTGFGEWVTITNNGCSPAANKFNVKQLTDEDLNDIKVEGDFTFYYADHDNTCINKPDTISNITYFSLQCIRLHNGYTKQIFNSSDYVFTRYFNSGTWSAWKKMLTEDDLHGYMKTWIGTQSEFDILSSKDNNTLYYITGE